MARGTAESLLRNKGFDAKDMAKTFAEEYVRDMSRSYGGYVVCVFAKLLDAKCEDPFGPAKKQFDGDGSFGNGAAMRAGPIPLFGHKLSNTDLVKLTLDCSLITHSNKLGYNGAILMSLAIREALNTKVIH